MLLAGVYGSSLLRTGASGYGIGAFLTQHQLGQEGATAYVSCVLSAAERHYRISKKECLAVVWSIVKFPPYLFGSPTLVDKGHRALWWLYFFKYHVCRLGLWAVRLQEYDIKTIHKTGKLYQDAECLS